MKSPRIHKRRATCVRHMRDLKMQNTKNNHLRLTTDVVLDFHAFGLHNDLSLVWPFSFSIGLLILLKVKGISKNQIL